MLQSVALEEQNSQLMMESREALQRIIDNRKVPLIEQTKKVVMNDISHLTEPFDQIALEGKIKVDMMYFNQFFEKLDENVDIDKVESLLGSLYSYVSQIYEFINIKPEIYGKNINTTILNESIGEVNKRLSSVVYEFLDINFYKLNPDTRQTKYYKRQKPIAEQLITEGTSVDDAVTFSIKTVIMEDLIRNIAFPFTIWSRVDYLTEDKDYGEIFDQDQLKDLVNTFKSKSMGIAKIIATCV